MAATHGSAPQGIVTPSALSVMGAAIGTSVAALDAHLPLVRAGDDPEGVHQARVAVRRLRSDLRTFGPLLDEQWATGLRTELAWLADELGRVRDLDVLMAHLGPVRSAVLSYDPGAADRLVAELARQREAEGVRLLACLDDERTVTMLEHLHAAVNGPVTLPAAESDAARAMFPLVRRPWRRLRRTVGGLRGRPSVEDLHRVRILTKRARYAAEAVVPVFGADAERFARRAGVLQEVLGDLNDAVVARRWLTETASRLDSSAAFAAGQLAQRMADRAEAGLGDWRRAYRRLERRARWLDRPVGADPRLTPTPGAPVTPTADAATWIA